MSIKFFQLSDFQLGTYIGKPVPLPNAAISVYQSTLDILKALDVVVEQARMESPDFILIPGDIFDRVINSRYVLGGLTSRLGKLANIAPVIIVVGNHDLVGNTHLMADWKSLPLSNMYIVDEPTILSLRTKKGKDVEFACAGWPVSILSNVVEVETNLLDETTKGRRTFHYLINEFIQSAIGQMNPDAIKVFVGHGTVLDFFTPEELKYSKEIVNDDVVFYKKNFEEYDYVAIGHIHLQKVVDNIAYAGSVYPANFGESNLEHGFLIVEIDEVSKTMSHKYIPVQVRKFYHANIKTSKHPEESDIISHVLDKFPADAEAFIKINVVFDDPASEIHLSIIESALKNYYNHIIVEPVYYMDNDNDFFASSNMVAVQPGETLMSIVNKYLLKRDDISDDMKEATKIKLRSYINTITMD